MVSEPAGYDDPISDEASDLLGRASFARELATLAISGPPGWSTRIGVYGDWGAGKTSVLRIVKDLLEGDGHFVVDFNPWGCTSATEMIELLAKDILRVGKQKKLPRPGTARRLAKWSAGTVATIASAADGVVPVPLVTGTARISPWLKRWAKERKKDIEEVVEMLDADRRLVVLADDIDRLDPKLLPGLLFAVHEVFALPGITFIVALDPQVVGSALQAYHPGFGDGLAFLEKIVQFPRWLPPVSAAQRSHVAEFDRQRHAPFMSASVLEVNQDLLPKNPREVRMLVRGLMPLARAVERHDSGELDQNLILLLECFRQRFPRTLAAVLEDEALLDSIPAILARDDPDAFVDRIRRLAERTQELSPGNVRLSERLDQLARAFCGRSLLWGGRYIRYHAQLLERPPAVTAREFAPLLMRARRDAAAIDDWIEHHMAELGVSPDDLLPAFFEHAVRAHDAAMNESADAETAAEQERAHGRVEASIELVRVLWFSSRHAMLVRTPDNFRRLLQTCRGWAHFELNPNDREARARERDLLLEIAREDSSPLQLLEQLAPWAPYDRDPRGAALTEDLAAVLRERCSEIVVAAFAEPSGISSALRSELVARRYVLGLPTTWKQERRKQLETLSASRREIVAENVRSFVEALVQDARARPEAGALLQDRPLVELFWHVISAVRWQARYFAPIQRLKTALEREEALPEPPWWAEVMALVDERLPSGAVADTEDED